MVNCLIVESLIILLCYLYQKQFFIVTSHIVADLAVILATEIIMNMQMNDV